MTPIFQAWMVRDQAVVNMITTLIRFLLVQCMVTNGRNLVTVKMKKLTNLIKQVTTTTDLFQHHLHFQETTKEKILTIWAADSEISKIQSCEKSIIINGLPERFSFMRSRKYLKKINPSNGNIVIWMFTCEECEKYSPKLLSKKYITR